MIHAPEQRDTFPNNRLLWFGGLVCLFSIGILVQLVRLHIFEAESLRKDAQRQYRQTVTLYPQRGTIFDRTGVRLTENLDGFISPGVKPDKVLDPKWLAKDIASVTGRPVKYYTDKLAGDRDFVHLERKLSPQMADKIKTLGWNLRYDSEVKRVYPHKSLAAQVIGFTDIADVGRSGIELMYNDLLSGKTGKRVVQLDVYGRHYLDEALSYIPPVDGGDIVLTIELAIQAILEEELGKALDYHNAVRASGIVLDPMTGEIISMASLPSLDPNEYHKYPLKNQRNVSTADMYELGSCMKIAAITLLLEKGFATAETTVDTDPGWMTIHGKTFKDANNHGLINVKEVLAYSSNIGMIKLMQDVDPEEIYEMMVKFGFNEKTGIEQPGETKGSMPIPKKWSGLTKPTIVIGQGIAVSLLQMSMGFAAIANGGELLQPTLIRGLRQTNMKVKPHGVEVKRRVMSSYNASVMTKCLEGTVEFGTAHTARIKDMPIAGKTGTAIKVDFENRKYHKDKYIATFCGYFPSRSPRYLILVSVDEPDGPDGNHGGGSVAAPLFRNVAERILDRKSVLYRLVKKNDSANADQYQVSVPDLRFKRVDEIKSIMREKDLKYKVSGEGSIIYDQIPPSGAMINAKEVVNLTVGPVEGLEASKVVVPLLSGLSLRDAVKKVTTAGLTFKVTGTGRVVSQFPLAGEQVSLGDPCTIHGEES